jgi:uncharacterized protein YgiM (DUF1202 family)
VITIVPQGEALYLVAADQGEWIQIALPDRQLAWVSSEFTKRVAETVALEEANRRREASGLALLAPPETAAALATAPSVTDTLTTTAPIAGPTGMSVTVNITAGINARENPTLDATVVQLLPVNSSYSAMARTADGQWVQIRLPDGKMVWATTQFLTPSGDMNALSTEPFVPGAATAPAQPITTTAVTTVSNPVTTTAASTVTQVANGVSASVTNLSGANARGTPDRNAGSIQVLPFDSVLPVVGRSADNEWIQVTLAEGQLAWVLVDSVKLNVELATLQVVTP